jgi:hypothetical protein
MKKQILVSLFFLTSFLNATIVYSAEDVADVIKMLNGKDWTVRERGVMAAMKISGNEQVKIELIKLLERENQQYEKLELGLPADDSSGEYYGELLNAVEQLNDPRAIKGLASAANSGSGVTNALINFGEIAIDPLMDVFVNSKRKTIKQGIVEITNRILKEKAVNPNRKNKVKRIFIQHINKTTNQSVRQSIAEAFDNFYDDDEVVNIVESLAASDTFYMPRRVKGRPRTEIVKEFTVKDEAQKTMGRIRAKRKEKHQELPHGTTQQNKSQ